MHIKSIHINPLSGMTTVLSVVVLGVIIIFVLLSRVYVSESKSNGFVRMSTQETGWYKLSDSVMGIELEYPTFLSASLLSSRTNDEKTIQLSRNVAYGERPGCNESGMARPQLIGYPEINIKIVSQNWNKYVADFTERYGYEPTYDKGIFSNSQEFFTEVTGWEGQCRSLTTYIQLDDMHLVVISEPMIDEVSAVGDGLKKIEEFLLVGEPRLDEQMRERILMSIQIKD